MDVNDFCQRSSPAVTEQLKERIKNLDKNIFFILSTARCRSSWFANFFTYVDTFCYNEETRYINSWEELIDRIEERPEHNVGFEDPELTHYIMTLYNLFPNATYVLLERDREESENSLFVQAKSFSREVISRKFDRWFRDINYIKENVPHYNIHFSQMDDINEISSVWNHVLPDLVFDVGRWNLLTSLRITVTIGDKPYKIPNYSMAPYFNFEQLDMIR